MWPWPTFLTSSQKKMKMDIEEDDDDDEDEDEDDEDDDEWVSRLTHYADFFERHRECASDWMVRVLFDLLLPEKQFSCMFVWLGLFLSTQDNSLDLSCLQCNTFGIITDNREYFSLQCKPLFTIKVLAVV